MKICFFGSYERTSNDIPSGNGGVLLKKILQTQDCEVDFHFLQHDHIRSTNFNGFTEQIQCSSLRYRIYEKITLAMVAIKTARDNPIKP